MSRVLLYWFPTALGITILSALVYLAVQQSYRQSANDPQIQLAEDAAAQLEAGQQPETLVGAGKVEIDRSLSTFLIIYDDAGQPLASSARLNGNIPTLPAGVFSSVRQSGEERLTWQPQEGVRSATVITHFGGSHPGFVLAGRSLREVEKREAQLTQFVGFAWLAALAGSLLAWAIALAVGDKLRA
jgi:hypothetical protein